MVLNQTEIIWSMIHKAIECMNLHQANSEHQISMSVVQNYPLCISLDHASGFTNSCIVFANEDSFAQSICKKDLASQRKSVMALGRRWLDLKVLARLCH